MQQGPFIKTIPYGTEDLAFIWTHPKKRSADVLRYLAVQGKTLFTALYMEHASRYSFDLFSMEKISFPDGFDTRSFLFRLGLFLEKDGVILHVTDSLKPLGFILPKTFVVSGTDLREHGSLHLHAFSYPENHSAGLPASFPVDLFLVENR